MSRGKKDSLHSVIEKALRETIIGKDLIPRPAYEGVYRIYIDFEPKVDIPGHDNYSLSLLFACTHERVKERLLQSLAGLAAGVKGKPVIAGLIMNEPEIEMVEQITVEQIRGMKWMTRWDDLSGFGDAPGVAGSL